MLQIKTCLILGPDGTAASGHIKPPPFPTEDRPTKPITPVVSDSEEEPAGEPGYGPGPTFVQEPPSEIPDVGYVDEEETFAGPKPTKGQGDA